MRFFLGGLLLLLTGCTHLDPRLRVTRAWSVSAECSQGPLEVTVPLMGTRWGEDFDLVAFGPPIHGQVVEKIGTWELRPRTVGRPAPVTNNTRCGGASSTGSAKLVPRDLPAIAPGAPATTLATWTFTGGPQGTYVRPGTTVTVTLWSAEPNDLRDVVFVLRQHELVPNVPDPEWAEYRAHQLDSSWAASRADDLDADRRAGRVAPRYANP